MLLGREPSQTAATLQSTRSAMDILTRLLALFLSDRDSSSCLLRSPEAGSCGKDPE